ncbi:hypothetical protein KSP39_PZI001425 [Platanthera zijinensis]|uniref:Uncharacterized protein n=1 Tax=Platanthera zijinensis TaxID=2320716 RepID=A0AAP0GG70_9ASPA
MDGREAAPEADPSVSRPKSLFPAGRTDGRTRGRDSVLEEPNKRAKRVKLRDLEAVIRSEEGIKISPLLSPHEKGIEDIENYSQEEISQITRATVSRLSFDRPLNNSSLEVDCSVIGVGHTINLQSSTTADSRHGVDLNNPFYPYKKLGQVRAADSSECGSTTGPMDSNESMRKWNEMKQQGFVSSFMSIAPIPKPRNRQPRKKKSEETKRKSNFVKDEMANKCTKVAAPSGLLSGLNPGIIKHVRNSKQVNSIIEAMLQNEKQELLHRSLEQSRTGTRGVILGPSEHAHALEADQLDLSLNKSVDTSFFESEVQNTESVYNTEFDDDALTLKLSSGLISSEHASNAAVVDVPLDQEDPASLSFRAASVASQWLGLIQQDLKGRLAALRRSKKRVKNAIQIELPYLLSRDHAPDQENESMWSQSSLHECPSKGTLDMHMARWKSLFGQMERSLMEEGKHLERWLRQVEELQSQCDKGLKFVSANELSGFYSAEDASVRESKESWEKECAVRAAAASIYSTSNLIMSAR